MTATTGQISRRQLWRNRGLAAVLDLATASHARAVAVLVLVSLLAFLPGFFQIPPVDRDEARFAQATKQMLETGDYVDIRFQNEVRYKKPVGIYWLQAAVVYTAAALGLPDAARTIWLYRIPSLLGAIGAVLLTYWAALAFVSSRAAVLAGLMMATSILLGVEARLGKTDAMLLLTSVAAMGAMARIYLQACKSPNLQHGWKWPAIFWTALAGGMLLKGPLILMFVGFAAAALFAVDRSARWLGALRPLPGLAWLALLVLPWFVAIVSLSGESFLVESVGNDLLTKLVSSQEGHGAPPGFYLLLFFVTFWPGAMLATLAAPRIWAARREPGARFLLAWLVPSWLVLEIVITKLPHYVLPLYPAVAILIAGVLDRGMLSSGRWGVRGTVWWFLVPVIIGVGAIVGLIVIDRQLGLPAWPFVAAAIISGLLAWRLYGADGPERSLLRASVASLFIACSVYGLVLPTLESLFPSAALASIMNRAQCPKAVAAAAGYHEPSLVFLAGTSTRLVSSVEAAEFLREGDCRFVFIDSREERSFAQRADAIGARYSLDGRVDGINISSGRRVSVAVYRSEPAL